MDTRELHENVLRSAQVIVEDVEAFAWDDVIAMAEVVSGEVALDPEWQLVFKTVGMPWEDLVATAGAGRIER